MFEFGFNGSSFSLSEALHCWDILLGKQGVHVGLIHGEELLVGFFWLHLLIEHSSRLFHPMAIEDGVHESGNICLSCANFAVKDDASSLLILLQQHHAGNGMDKIVIL